MEVSERISGEKITKAIAAELDGLVGGKACRNRLWHCSILSQTRIKWSFIHISHTAEHI
jgi:hypothetical protein